MEQWDKQAGAVGMAGSGAATFSHIQHQTAAWSRLDWKCPVFNCLLFWICFFFLFVCFLVLNGLVLSALPNNHQPPPLQPVWVGWPRPNGHCCPATHGSGSLWGQPLAPGGAMQVGTEGHSSSERSWWGSGSEWWGSWGTGEAARAMLCCLAGQGEKEGEVVGRAGTQGHTGTLGRTRSAERASATAPALPSLPSPCGVPWSSRWESSLCGFSCESTWGNLEFLKVKN